MRTSKIDRDLLKEPVLNLLKSRFVGVEEDGKLRTRVISGRLKISANIVREVCDLLEQDGKIKQCKHINCTYIRVIND